MFFKKTKLKFLKSVYFPFMCNVIIKLNLKLKLNLIRDKKANSKTVHAMRH